MLLKRGKAGRRLVIVGSAAPITNLERQLGALCAEPVRVIFRRKGLGEEHQDRALLEKIPNAEPSSNLGNGMA